MVNHPNRNRPKSKFPSSGPDQTFENAARKAGAVVRDLWAAQGPKGTSIAWMVCYAVNDTTVIVKTIKNGGWVSFPLCPTTDPEQAVAIALRQKDLVVKRD